MSDDAFSLNRLLVLWYADPLIPEQARKQAISAQERLASHHSHGTLSFIAVMQQMIADWWLDESQIKFPDRGIHYANTKRKQALYHLVAGQLLMSCKLQSAMDYLDMGLRQADGVISSENYFTLYNRHEELRFLKLSHERQMPRSLLELLNESRVMRKLAPKYRYSMPNRI